MSTAFIGEGYFDIINCDAAQLKANTNLIKLRQTPGSIKSSNITYEFCLIPNAGFLGNEDLLLKDTELKLSFDRTLPELSLLADPAPESVASIEIADCYAVTEYVSSPEVRKYFDTIDTQPLRFEFEDCEVYTKQISQDETNIRFDNLRGGNTPSHMFVGLIQSAALNGDLSKSSTRFSCHGVNKMNISLNGNSVNGYPLKIHNGISTKALTKFIECTNRICNISTGQMMTDSEFAYNWLWSHCFESEETSRGWIGIDFELENAFSEPMTMVVWVISPAAITVDKFHQIEKINM